MIDAQKQSRWSSGASEASRNHGTTWCCLPLLPLYHLRNPTQRLLVVHSIDRIRDGAFWLACRKCYFPALWICLWLFNPFSGKLHIEEHFSFGKVAIHYPINNEPILFFIVIRIPAGHCPRKRYILINGVTYNLTETLLFQFKSGRSRNVWLNTQAPLNLSPGDAHFSRSGLLSVLANNTYSWVPKVSASGVAHCLFISATLIKAPMINMMIVLKARSLGFQNCIWKWIALSACLLTWPCLVIMKHLWTQYLKTIRINYFG